MTAVYTELQPVFNKIWQEFVAGDRERALASNGMGCVYRGDRDAASETRCALGVCIPDDMYNPEIDRYGSITDVRDHMSEWYESVFNGIGSEHLQSLQYIHDLHFGTFEDEMRAFAKENNLTIPKN